MSWLTKLRTYLGHDEEKQVATNPEGSADANTALLEAYNTLDQARQRRAEFREVATHLTRLNNANHYGEAIYLSMMPRKKRV